METGLFEVITQSDLLFSPEEIEWLGAGKKLVLTPEQIHDLLNGYHLREDGMHPETLFSAHMILAAILYAMGSHLDADQIMSQTEVFIKEKAQFLYVNLKALQTELAIRSGNIDAAKEWLAIFENRAERLPFYQMCRHFTALRSYIALGDFARAAEFGKRLNSLATEYNRPLDQLESGLLMAMSPKTKLI